MAQKRVRLLITARAAQAVLEQAAYYTVRENRALGARWDAAVMQCIQSLTKMPNRGSPCLFEHPELRNLRRIAVPGFPRHLIFYEYLPEQSLVRVVHVLHGARDFEALFAERPEHD